MLEVYHKRGECQAADSGFSVFPSADRQRMERIKKAKARKRRPRRLNG
jgi:hypothetical protein